MWRTFMTVEDKHGEVKERHQVDEDGRFHIETATDYERTSNLPVGHSNYIPAGGYRPGGIRGSG